MDEARSVVMNWKGCELVEQIPGKVSGKPVIRDTRILADTIIEDAELGSSVEEIHENYPSVPVEQILKLLAFANSSQKQAQP
jgi:uncharacterized protein (DUF433 family)